MFLHVPPDAFGQEHECWFDEENNQWFKATYINRFGLAWGRDGSATANEYLTRLVLQNVHFADSIRLECLINCDQRLRILTTQPHIVGEAADYREIQDWFIKLGFERLKIDDRIAWYHSTENVLVADAHEGNVIKTATGSIVPIDLNIVQPDSSMRDAISELIGK